LKQLYPHDPVVQDVLLRMTMLKRGGKNVTLCWIPSHVGIRGNELADQAAKRAARRQYTHSLPLPATHFSQAINAFFQDKWQQVWDSTGENKLRTIRPTLGCWKSSSRTSRRKEVLLARIRIGHTYATHGYLLRNEDRPMCTRCDMPLTVRHVLLVCPLFSAQRRRFFGRDVSTLTMADLLGDGSRIIHSGRLFEFLSQVPFDVVYSGRS